MRRWSIDDSAELYGIPNWGREFLRIGEDGHLIVAPHGEDGPWVDLKRLVDDIRRRGIRLPILLRFPDLLEARVRALAGAFAAAIQEHGYRGHYRGVYPVKVNQQRHLVEQIVASGGPFHLGLECGSKPELLVVLALMDDPAALIICNGYKDEKYIETALLAQRMGRRPIIVIEKFSEVHTALALAERHGIDPILGVRAKLASKGAGRWEASTGDGAKFGLTVLEMVQLVDLLAARGKLSCLQLLHFHIGSQVSAIRSFKAALRESSRVYVELRRLGAPLRYLDVGGGLGVDYDGSSTDFASSVNYTIDEYAQDVVLAIQRACDEADQPHPHIVTEAGRALVAHHAVLLFNVLGVSSRPTASARVEVGEHAPEVLQTLAGVLEGGITEKSYQAAWHDAIGGREQALNMFNLGLLDLRQRATAERLYWQIVGRIGRLTAGLSYVPDDLAGLERALADIYFCNFSVFQSMPDAWAVDQLFPVVPIHRLDEEPRRRAVLADITCDSDGKLDRFIDRHDVKRVLELHDVSETDGESYVLGSFLVGAYQEILGDLHNLFGDTNAVTVRLGHDGDYELVQVQEGDRVTDVVGYVQYDQRELLRRIRSTCEQAVRQGVASHEDTARLVEMYREGLQGYTYLE